MCGRRVFIVGGGIAGLSCLEGLILDYDEKAPQYEEIILISDTKLVKKVTNYRSRGRGLEEFDVTEDDISTLIDIETLPKGLKFQFIVAHVQSLDSINKTIGISYSSQQKNHDIINYDILCFCCGARPKRLEYPSHGIYPALSDRLIFIRDTSTVASFQRKLVDCRKLTIIGNGGISLELITKLKGCEKIWIIRDGSIGFHYFDSGAAKFMTDQNKSIPERAQGANSERVETCISSVGVSGPNILRDMGNGCTSTSCLGPALGPNWSKSFDLKGKSCDNSLRIVYQDEIDDIKYDELSTEGQVIISTRKGQTIKCDLVAIAIGVEPNSPKCTAGDLRLSDRDRGIIVDDQMRTSLSDVYAAGDVVSCEEWPKNELWFQMRLWTQARQMGFYAGRCIANHLANLDPSIYFNFDCFTHCTTFFDQRLVLLGLYNGQDLDDEEASKYEVIARVIEGKDYIKLILKENKVIGAVLVGDSGLEETIENLIHNQMDIGDQKDRLLDGSVDIEDYFD